MHRVSPAGGAGTILDSGVTVNGQVAFEHSTGATTFLIACTGGTYVDEATGTTLTAPALRTVVQTTSDIAVTVSPLTEMAVALAADFNSVDYSVVATAFGLGDIDLVNVVPTDLNTATAGDDAAGNYAQILALLSQYQADQSASFSEVLATFNTELASSELSDGIVASLSNAAANLGSSAIAGSLNTDALEALVEEMGGTVQTRPEVTFSPNTLAFTLGGQGETTLTVENAVLDGVSCSSQNLTYSDGVVTATEAGSYTCTAYAYDEQQNAGQATLTVTVTQVNTAPVAAAGDDITAPTGSKVSFDGSASSDVENDNLTYSWTLLSKPNGSNASLADATSAMASLVPDVDGAYQVQLTVSDGLDAHSDTLDLTAQTNTWVINNSEVGAYIAALVNVQSVSVTSVGQNSFNRVTATGIPNYEFVLTQDDVDSLNARPKANADFVGGQTSAQAGQTLSFGEDIGYNIIHQGCDLGYWPPGPVCPTDQAREANIPAEPTPASSECATTINTMGLMLNGTSIYNWSDGVSYNNEGVWDQLAPEFEIFDVDICGGHAQTAGDYHHHMFSKCLADQFADDGQAHSPIYGYAADGYPVYGPYYAKGVLAKSSWVKRNYANVAEGGCADGKRSCLLNDEYDLSQGTTVTASTGPDTDATVTSNSGNAFLVESGYYLQDYYHDAALTALGGEYLDDHNGHNHDELGYHYHTTVVADDDGNLIPVFPYNIGPNFYGQTRGGAVYHCRP